MDLRRTSLRLLALVAAAGAAGCGDSEAEAAERAREEYRTELARRAPRERGPAERRVAGALEAGRTGEARRALPSVPDGVGKLLLAARLATLEGDGVAAVRALEEARERYPKEPGVWATASEVHAWAGRLESAEAEVREGLERFGPHPELSRARGVLLVCREGGAEAGLRHLDDALAADPELDFTLRARTEAHRLIASRALGEGDVVAAVRHAREARALAPEDPEVLLLLADALASAASFEEAITVYEDLLARGQDVAGTLALTCQRGATAALLAQDKDAALERYLRARELGISEDDLGHGRHFLDQAFDRAVDEGTAAYDAGDLDGAAAAFRRARRIDPGSLVATNHLGVALFRAGDFDGAAECWRTVLDGARERGLELPEPVHLNLARSLYQAGRTDEVRALLEDHLARQPDGPWAADTREMLERLGG